MVASILSLATSLWRDLILINATSGRARKLFFTSPKGCAPPVTSRNYRAQQSKTVKKKRTKKGIKKKIHARDKSRNAIPDVKYVHGRKREKGRSIDESYSQDLFRDTVDPSITRLIRSPLYRNLVKRNQNRAAETFVLYEDGPNLLSRTIWNRVVIFAPCYIEIVFSEYRGIRESSVFDMCSRIDTCEKSGYEATYRNLRSRR